MTQGLPEFTQPGFLWLLLAVPPLFLWWLLQRHGSLRHPAAASLARLPAGRSMRARWNGALLRAMALICLVLALSGPRWPDRKTRLATEGIAIELVVDVSGSMAERDFEWDGLPVTRLDAVKRAFRLFVAGGVGPGGVSLEGRPTDLMGLVTFGTRPDSACPLTLSHSVLLRILDEQKPRSVPGESETNVSDAVLLGLHRVQSAGPRRKVLVVLSDGEHNVAAPASGMTPRQAAQLAASMEVPVYTIDAGSDLPAGVSEAPGRTSTVESRQAGVRTLQEVSRISGGEYFRADSTARLLEVCKAIDRKERERIMSFQYRRYHEGYPWFALASFVFLGSVLLLELTIWRRLPA